MKVSEFRTLVPGSPQLPDDYQIKGLDEIEIRLLASDNDFEQQNRENLLANDDPAHG